MYNTIITPETITKEFLMQLENQLVLAPLVNQEYKREYEKGGVKKGQRSTSGNP